MKTLYLPLKYPYFMAIFSGVKKAEYRLYNNYWRKRIEGKDFDRIVLTSGYPRKDEEHRHITRPWRGYAIETITHPQFGENPVRVFAINVHGIGSGKEIPKFPLTSSGNSVR